MIERWPPGTQAPDTKGDDVSIDLGFYSMTPGESAWLVMHNDNSDNGEAREFFPSESAARGYIGALPQPPEGNESHPAPEKYNLRLFRVESVAETDA